MGTSRGYQIFSRSKEFRDNWDTIFGHKKSPAKSRAEDLQIYGEAEYDLLQPNHGNDTTGNSANE